MKFPRFANTLVVRLIGFGVLLVLIGTVARYFILSSYVRDNLIQITSAQQATLAEAAAEDINYKLMERFSFLKRLAKTLPPDLLQQPAKLQAWLQERAKLQPLFSLGLMATDVQGTVLADFPTVPGRVGQSLSGNPNFQQLIEGKSGIGAPVVGSLTQQPLIPMGIPIKDETGIIQGVLIGVTALSAPNFLNFLQHAHSGTASGFRLVSPKDQLLMDFSHPDVMLEPTPPHGANPFLDRAIGGFRGSGVTRNAQGVEEIAAAASIPSMGWFVVAHVPTSVALAAVDQTKSYLLWHLLLLLGIGLPAIGGFITWVLRPLYRSAEKAEKMSRGEIPLQPFLIERDDEVGHLTRAFNNLLIKLTDSQAALEHLAYHDALTGLPNRSLLIDRIHQAQARSKRHGTRLAVLFLDLDGFKQINDSFGHDAGDLVLKETAQRLSLVIRQVDTLARIGGDEFVILATDLDTEAKQAVDTVAAKCVEAVSVPISVQDVTYQISVSIGVALCSRDCTAECLLLAADKAMYVAKQQGQGSYRMASSCEEHIPACVD